MAGEGGKIALDAHVVSYHAARVERLADDVQVAIDAANSMNLMGGAFGLMCSFLIGPATTVTSFAKEGMHGVEGVLRESARELRAGLAEVAAFEEHVISEVRDLGSELGL